MVVKMDTRFKRKRHLNITFTSVSVVKSLYLTIFLSTCFLTCLFLWISKYDNETSMMLSQGHLSNRKMKAPLFSFGLAGTVTVDPLVNSNFKKELTSWATDGGGGGGGGEATSTAVGDFVTDFDISIDEAELNLDLDIISAEQKQKKLHKSNERRRQDEDHMENFLNRDLDLGLAEVEVTMRPAASSSTANKPLTSHVMLDHLDVDGGIQQAVDHYEERQNLVQSYCKSNPVFNVGRHRLSLDMFHLLNGKTNMWVRSSSKFPFPRFSNDNNSSSIGTVDINTVSNSTTTTAARKVNLEWCPIFKAASTPWMALLMRLKNHLYPRTEDLIRNGKLTFVKLARLFHMQIEKPSHTFAYLSPTSQLKKAAVAGATIPNSSLFNLNIAMLIVRHPFERLLSAYKDKLERIQGRLYYHRKYGIPIVQKYRYRQQGQGQSQHKNQPAGRMRIHRRSINPTDARGLSTTTRTLLVEAMRNDVHSKFQDWQKSFAVPLLTMRMNQNVEEYQLNKDDGETLMDLNLDSSSSAGNRITSASFFNRFQRAQGHDFKDRIQSRAPDLIPTFNEFVQYLLHLSPLAMDEHWRPIFVDCNACNGPRDRIRGEGGNIVSPFNLILKVETMDEDRDFLLSLLGVNQTLKSDLDLVWKRWTNPSHNNERDGSEPTLLTSTPNGHNVDVGNGSSYDNYNHIRNGNSDSNMRSLKKNFKYFSQVSKQDLKALYLMYEPDFQMFGYSANEYIAMGK